MAETTWTAWHYFLHLLLSEKGSTCFEYRCEEPLTKARQSIDWLLLRRHGGASDGDDRAQTLRRLWRWLPDTTLVEFKSASKGYRARELHRLLGYGEQYYAANADTVATPDALALVLMVGVGNEPLDRDIAARTLRREDLGDGYWRLHGAHFPLLLIDITAVASHDRDDPIVLFARNLPATPDAKDWWYAHTGKAKDIMDPSRLAEYKEMERQFLAKFTVEERLEGLAPEDVLPRFKPGERLVGLTPAQAVLALPDAVLRGLSPEYIATLPDDVQRIVRERLAR